MVEAAVQSVVSSSANKSGEEHRGSGAVRGYTGRLIHVATAAAIVERREIRP